MKSWQQIGENLGDAWGILMAGWRRLCRRAGKALPRFTPGTVEEHRFRWIRISFHAVPTKKTQ